MNALVTLLPKSFVASVDSAVPVCSFDVAAKLSELRHALDVQPLNRVVLHVAEPLAFAGGSPEDIAEASTRVGVNLEFQTASSTHRIRTVCVEDTTQDWYQLLTTQYQLPATTPLLRLLIQQSNCFVIVDRGRAMAQMQTERDMARNGDLRANSNMGAGQMVAADYTMTPSIQFAQQTGGGGIGALVGMLNPYAGLVAGGMRKVDAATTLILVDGRSGVQVAISEGVASKKDFSFGAIVGGGGGAVGMGAWQSTPQGKVIAGAFMDAFNQMVQATRGYAAQRTGPNGLGTGGALGVSGANTPPTPVSIAQASAPLNIRSAQIRLAELTLYSGAIDGQAGAGTSGAIKKFQAIRGLPVSGVLDAATSAALSK